MVSWHENREWSGARDEGRVDLGDEEAADQGEDAERQEHVMEDRRNESDQAYFQEAPAWDTFRKAKAM